MEVAPAELPLGSWVERWQAAIAKMGWTPWLILGLAVFLRFFLLGIKPPHFDEGINGWFVDQMVKNGFYRYDPTNYHGPLHFYVLFLSQMLLGRNIWALRLPVVLVSCACVWLTLKFEPLVGRNVSRLAALAMAVSPGFVFYGRYSIHEVWMLFFSILFLFGGLGLWKFGARNYLWCAGMGVTGMILSKETYVIHVICALVAILVVWGSTFASKLFGKRQQLIISGLLCVLLAAFFMPWIKVGNTNVSGIEAGKSVLHHGYLWALPFLACATIAWSLNQKDNRLWGGLLGLLWFAATAWVSTALTSAADNRLLIGGKITLLISAAIIAAAIIPSNTSLSDGRRAKQSWDYFDLTMVIAVGVALIVFFYSGTFFHWSGVKGLYEAYKPWFATGNEGHGHEKPWYYWLKIMSPSFESTSLFLSPGFSIPIFSRADCLGYELPALLGLILCLFSLRFRNVTLRYLAVYAVGTFFVYSYVNYKTPWCIISFIWPLLFIFATAVELAPAAWQKLTTCACGALVSISLISSIWLNYFHCTTDDEPYVYVQTYNDIFKLTDPLLALAHRDPLFYQLTGHIVRASAYPLPWILDDFPKVGYYEHNNSPPSFDADFLLVQEDRIQEVESKLHDSYYTEPLRIRPYQDTSKLFLSARIFKGFFPGREPNFIGKPVTESKQ